MANNIYYFQKYFTKKKCCLFYSSVVPHWPHNNAADKKSNRVSADCFYAFACFFNKCVTKALVMYNDKMGCRGVYPKHV